MVQLGCDMVTVQGGEGGGHTGAVPTTVLLPQVLDAVKCPWSRRRLWRWARPGGGAGVWRGGRGDGHALPDDGGKPGARKRPRRPTSRRVPSDIGVSTKVDGMPQRMILNPLLRRIEASGKLGMWLRAMEAGLAMKRQTGWSVGQVIASARRA
jgi:NAD(P)H-dependent flavin oxidoreductase YrpB (nitropropane dioxygenase family)